MADKDVLMNLCKAFYTLFLTANDFNTSVNGRLFENIAPDGTSYPYAVYTIVSAPKEKTFSEEYTNTLLQLTLYSSNMDSTEIKNMYHYAHELFDEAEFTMVGSTLVWMRKELVVTDVQDEITPSGTQKVRVYDIDFDIRTSLN